MKHTPFYDRHVAIGARMVPFAGFSMPLQYRGIVDEHRWVRQSAGLFDVSHMGELEVEGPDAGDALAFVLAGDPRRLAVHQVLYSPLLNEQGGVVDDLLVYRLGEQRFLLVVNAANTEKDEQFLREHLARFQITLRNRSEDIAQIALQGPRAEAILQKLTDADLSRLRYYWSAQIPLLGHELLISRTGYTGEDGFEVYGPPDPLKRVWDRLVEDPDVRPAGLGARDTLRLEMGYPLYGNDLSDEITPLEAGLGWTVAWDKPSFLGKEVLIRQKERGVERIRVGIKTSSRRHIPRPRQTVVVEGNAVGQITSGTLSPTLNVGIALALIRPEHRTPGTPLTIAGHRTFPAEVVRLPFVTGTSLKRT